MLVRLPNCLTSKEGVAPRGEKIARAQHLARVLSTGSFLKKLVWEEGDAAGVRICR